MKLCGISSVIVGTYYGSEKVIEKLRNENEDKTQSK